MQQPDQFFRVFRRNHFNALFCGRQFERNDFRKRFNSLRFHHFQWFGPGTHNAFHIRNPLFGHSFLTTHHQRQATSSVSSPPSTSRTTVADWPSSSNFAGKRNIGQIKQSGNHAANGRSIVINGFLSGENKIISTVFCHRRNL